MSRENITDVHYQAVGKAFPVKNLPSILMEMAVKSFGKWENTVKTP